MQMGKVRREREKMSSGREIRIEVTQIERERQPDDSKSQSLEEYLDENVPVLPPLAELAEE